ncbi:DUF1992 domain-containing protein [Aeromicrobium sp. CFBP 8757]|uniref:DnaJ family domain-containing protein n=1 Tax=Aeromicrobium sp. CFBP 8757 TaxID=2775288 RepID=UPI001785B7B0|nr:DUF1992 domain-containing protein [Aeromicrobium sp. CFBP 8757]MBD8606267.1 DUF1992 domain-containing protein [Aeromicrobium sp. CFBP 8757]
MSASDRKRFEYRQRLAAEAAAAQQGHDDDEEAPDEAAARAHRMQHQAQWVDMQIQQAIRRGDFDDLPGAGKPIAGIDRPHDPDWWLKRLIERERITGVLPPALALRTEHAEIATTLDRITTPDGVRTAVADFNARVVEARRQLQGGPPVVTPLLDADDEVDAWHERRTRRVAEQKARLAEIRAAEAAAAPPPRWRRWRRRGRPSP